MGIRTKIRGKSPSTLSRALSIADMIWILFFALVVFVGQTAKAQTQCASDSDLPDQIHEVSLPSCVAECEALKCGEVLGSEKFSCENHCRNQKLSPLDLARGCGKATLNAAIGFVTFPWDAFAATVRTSQALAEKQRDPEIVRQVAFEAGFLTKVSKNDLRDYTVAEKAAADDLLKDIEIGDLLRKRENLRAMAARDAKYEKWVRDHHIPLPNLDQRTSPTEDAISLVDGYLKRKGVQWQCLNDEGRAEMFCDGVISVATAAMTFRSLARFASLKAATVAEEAGSARVASSAKLKAAPNAEDVVGRKLSPETKQAIDRAHKVGAGEAGRDGTPARVGNYTDSQLRQKSQILKDAGLSTADRRALVESGVVGYDPSLIQPGHTIAIAREDGLANAKVLRKSADSVDVEITDSAGHVHTETGIPLAKTSEKLAAGSGQLKANDTVFFEIKDGGFARGRLAKIEGAKATVEFESKKPDGSIETLSVAVNSADLRTIGSSVNVKKITGDFNPGVIREVDSKTGMVKVEVRDPRGTFTRALPADQLHPGSDLAPASSTTLQPASQAPVRTSAPPPVQAAAAPPPSSIGSAARPAKTSPYPWKQKKVLTETPELKTFPDVFVPAKNPKVFYQAEGRRHGMQTFCPAGNCAPESLAKHLYGSTRGEELTKSVTALNKNWAPLISDPGLMQRIDEFTKFVHEHKLENAAPWDARGKFAESLGVKKVYRALALNPDELAKIKANGIESTAVLYNNFPARPKVMSIVNAIHERPTASRGPDYLHSVTSDRDVAASIAHYEGKGKPYYVFELEVPKIDLLHIDSEGKAIGKDATYGNQMNRNYLEITDSHGKKVYHEYSGDVESMILFEIPPDEIVSVSPQDSATAPAFQWVGKPEAPKTRYVPGQQLGH